MKIRKAILIVHGFAGGTYDQEVLAHYLQLNSLFDVYAFTLPGHEYACNMHATYEEWILESKKQVQYLIDNGYKKIYVIGHSMGGVISTFLATQYKEIKKLVLVAPAFKYFYDKEDHLLDVLKKGNLILKDYGYETVVNRFIKASTSSVKEFMKLVKKYYYTPSQINIPTLLIQGLNDKIVPKESSEYVYNNLKGEKKIIYFEDVTHDVFRGKNVDKINREIEKFLIGR